MNETNPVALYDCLNCAAVALVAAEGGRGRDAETAFLEASIAASEAFPLSSPESQALGVVLAEVGRAMQAGAAA